MAKLKLNWVAPTTNVDGSPITHKLNYELGLKNADGSFTALFAVVGNLQPNNTFDEVIDNDNIPDHGALAMRAINTFDTAATTDDLTSAWSAPVEFTISNGIPNAPADVTADATGTEIKFSWSAPTTNTDDTPISHALAYDLGFKGEDGEFGALQTVEAVSTETGFEYSIAKDGIQTGVELVFALRAVNTRDTEALEDDLQSAWSAPVSFTLSNGIPEVPGGFTAQIVEGALKLVWTQPQGNTDGTPIEGDVTYELGRQAADGSFEVLRALPAGAEADIDLADFTAPGEYTVALRSVSTAGVNSDWSVVATFAISNGIPQAPTDFIASVEGDVLVVSWTAPVANTDDSAIAGDLSYQLGLRGEDGAFAPVQDLGVEAGESTSTVGVSQFAKSVEHVAALRATSSTGTSDWSESASFIINDETPEAPSGFSVASE